MSNTDSELIGPSMISLRRKLIEEISDSNIAMEIPLGLSVDELQRCLPCYPGDIVKLKSGGPLLTVQGCTLAGDNILSVRCCWFDFSGQYWVKDIQAVFLKKISGSFKPRRWNNMEEET